MKERKSWIAVAMMLAMAFGFAMSASASDASDDSEQHRQALIRGREVVWVTPSEKPYALTGAQRQEGEQDREPTFHFQGRAGIQYR